MNFQVGQKVVCVDNTPRRNPSVVNWPNKGEVYTVRAIRHWEDELAPGVLLEEITNPPIKSRYGLVEGDFYAWRFRPVKATNIDVFLKMLEPAPEYSDV